LWLVREGESYVGESLEEEDMSYQSTGDQFATVKSARTALGHDDHGRLILLQIEGETWSSGVDLFEMADLLLELGGEETDHKETLVTGIVSWCDTLPLSCSFQWLMPSTWMVVVVPL